ncbi:uncharacterized protein LOC121192283 [Toxotes jaculatrix]|uniref:uncharacterized protein LOC121192283 n=1 Tax=Toxotes jaculatrix TaxID=941984 RepID=UPI001B3AF400|nr:uncharacterized protein LOC121192283 [Toxotes jaculatrix]
MDPERERKEEFLRTQEALRRNAFKIISTMLDWCNKTPGSKHLVDEMLHCIFFLGKVNNAPYTPESIIGDQEMLRNLKEKYPRPFQCYLTQLPKRSPFSCVMDMTVLQKGQENEDQIRKSLGDLINSLEEKFLVSSTICVSQKSSNSVRYYGVSMSTDGPNPGRIVIAASCLSTWDDYVAGAVMTYYPKKIKKEYFDGTIKLPQNSRCQAFSLSKGGQMPPCRSCGNLFGLHTDEKREWDYGNCAEAESVSNLLKHEEEVKNKSKPMSPTCTPENRQRAKEDVLTTLRSVLSTVRFKTWDNTFYNPVTQ